MYIIFKGPHGNFFKFDKIAKLCLYAIENKINLLQIWRTRFFPKSKQYISCTTMGLL